MIERKKRKKEIKNNKTAIENFAKGSASAYLMAFIEPP